MSDKKLTVVPFEEQHSLYLFDHLRDDPDARSLRHYGDINKVAAAFAQSGTALTLLVDGNPACASGVVIIWPGVAEVWTIASTVADTIPLRFFRTVKKYLDWAIVQYNLHRVQATIRVDCPQWIRWIKLMGFEEEGVMRQFGFDKADHYRFARIIK